MNFADTHCHLYAEEYKDDYLVELQRALDAGVTTIVMPAIDSESHDALFALAEKNPCFYPLVGLHPTSVTADNTTELLFVEKLLASKKVYGIGEIGMDLYWSKEFEKQQREVFASQIELSVAHGLPIVIHSRDAFAEIFDILKSFKGKPVRGILHAFTGDYNDYKTIDSLGDFVMGIGGIVTFKNSGLSDVVSKIPLSRIVLETDSPYLAPTPFRGRRNSPANIPVIAKKVAEIKDVPIEQVAEETTATAKLTFNI